MYRNTRITVRIPESRKRLLEQWAKDDNCTVSDLINNLIENRLRREKRHAKEAENKTKGD